MDSSHFVPPLLESLTRRLGDSRTQGLEDSKTRGIMVWSKVDAVHDVVGQSGMHWIKLGVDVTTWSSIWKPPATSWAPWADHDDLCNN